MYCLCQVEQKLCWVSICMHTAERSTSRTRRFTTARASTTPSCATSGACKLFIDSQTSGIILWAQGELWTWSLIRLTRLGLDSAWETPVSSLVVSGAVLGHQLRWKTQIIIWGSHCSLIMVWPVDQWSCLGLHMTMWRCARLCVLFNCCDPLMEKAQGSSRGLFWSFIHSKLDEGLGQLCCGSAQCVARCLGPRLPEKFSGRGPRSDPSHPSLSVWELATSSRAGKNGSVPPWSLLCSLCSVNRFPERQWLPLASKSVRMSLIFLMPEAAARYSSQIIYYLTDRQDASANKLLKAAALLRPQQLPWSHDVGETKGHASHDCCAWKHIPAYE